MRANYPFLFLSVGVLFAMASASGFSAETDENQVRVDLRVFNVEREPIENLFIISDGEIVPIKFYPKARSEIYEYEGPKRIRFYDFSRINSDNPAASPVMGEVWARPGIDEALVFFLGKPDGELPYSLLFTDDSESHFPFGSVRVLNGTGSVLAGKVSDITMQLGFEASPPIEMDELRGEEAGPGSTEVAFAFAVRMEGGYELVFANRIRFRDDQRSILVLRPPRRPRSLRVYSYLLEESESSLARDAGELPGSPEESDVSTTPQPQNT